MAESSVAIFNSNTRLDFSNIIVLGINQSTRSYMVHAFAREVCISEQQSADIDVQTVW